MPIEHEGKQYFSAEERDAHANGLVSRKTKGLIDPNSDEYKGAMEKLSKYQETEFKSNVSAQFTKYNGETKRVDDFMKISGITKDSKPEEIETKVKEFRTNKDYGFLFKAGQSQHEMGLGGEQKKAPTTFTRKSKFELRKNRK